MKFVEIDGVKYEVFSFWRSVFKTLANPWRNWGNRWVLKKIMTWSGSPLAKESMQRPGGWRAMEIIYENAPPLNFIDSISCRYNAFPMALRNRRRYVTRKIAQLISEFSEKNDRVYVVGIGAGPGTNTRQAILDSGIDKAKVVAYLIDMDSDAFEYGREAARKCGLEEQIHYIQGDAREIRKHLPLGIHPHIVKMIGIVEYFTDDQLREMFKVVHDALTPGGALITHSLEDYHNNGPFLRRALNWNIHTRTRDAAMGILKEVGFRDMESFTTPMKIYTMITGRK